MCVCVCVCLCVFQANVRGEELRRLFIIISNTFKACTRCAAFVVCSHLLFFFPTSSLVFLHLNRSSLFSVSLDGPWHFESRVIQFRSAYITLKRRAGIQFVCLTEKINTSLTRTLKWLNQHCKEHGARRGSMADHSIHRPHCTPSTCSHSLLPSVIIMNRQNPVTLSLSSSHLRNISHISLCALDCKRRGSLRNDNSVIMHSPRCRWKVGWSFHKTFLECHNEIALQHSPKQQR